jgi:hypothetical protein
MDRILTCNLYFAGLDAYRVWITVASPIPSDSEQNLLQKLRKYLSSHCIMLKDHQNESTRKGHKKLNVTNLRTEQLNDSYCTEFIAPRIKVAAICNLSKFFVIVLIPAQPNAE